MKRGDTKQTLVVLATFFWGVHGRRHGSGAGERGPGLGAGDLDDDTLSGDLGDDRYYFAEGEGNDVIEEKSGYDTIICAPTAGRPKARLVGWSRVGNDLTLLMSGNGSVRVKDYYTMPSRSIDMVVGCQ